MSELQTRNMCESCAWDKEAEFHVPDEGNMCSGCFAEYEEEREKAHTCDECGTIVEQHYQLESVSDTVKMCGNCIMTVDNPNKDREVREKGWDQIIYEKNPWELAYYAYQAQQWYSSPVREFVNLEEEPNNAKLQRLQNEFYTYISTGNAGMAELVLADIKQCVKDQLG